VQWVYVCCWSGGGGGGLEWSWLGGWVSNTRNSQCYTGLFYSAVHYRLCRLSTVLLMMCMMMPETCWDTNKYIIFAASGWLFIYLHDSRCTVTWNYKSVYGKVKYYELIKHANTYSVTVLSITNLWKHPLSSVYIPHDWTLSNTSNVYCVYLLQSLLHWSAKEFCTNCTALSTLYILSRLCNYCPVPAPSFWCRPIRFDCIANATDIQRFCKTWHRVFGGDSCAATDTTGVALQ
jgi:hypothetical protein